MVSKRVLVVAVCVAVLIVAVGAYGYALYSEISSLKDQISLKDQELEELWEELNALEPSNSTNNTMNFTFTWGPETQDIVDGTFQIDVSVWFEDNILPDNTTTKMFYIVVSVYDDDHCKDDYLGLVLDMNHNGVIDLDFEDDPLIVYGDDSTIIDLGPVAVGLLREGFLGVAEVPRVPAHNKCVYDPEKGYVFGTFGYRASDITSQFGDMPAYIPVHICFADGNLYPGVHGVSFQFRIYL